MKRGVDAKNITIIAKHIPGDLSHEYASPFAGATAPCVKSEDPQIQYFSKFSFETIPQLQKDLGGPRCGLDITTNTETWVKKPSDKVIRGFMEQIIEPRELESFELPKQASYGVTYKSWSFNSPLLTENLYHYVKDKGVSVTVKTITHINEAFLTPQTIVFNCTGLGAKNIGGIEDKEVFPTRGQVVVIRAPNINECRLHWAEDSSSYMISRPGTHEVILGGFYQPHNDNRDVLGTETDDIIKRTTSLFPILGDTQKFNGLDIARVVSAFRPSRTSGPRIEKQQLPGNKVVIHNYGAAGTGFTQGLGMAHHSINLLKPAKL